MIRHITSEEIYEKIIEEGYVLPSNRGRECGVVSFEMFSSNNILVELIRRGKPEFASKKLIGIIID